MKKILGSFLAVFLLVSLLSVVSLAETVPFEEDYVKENDIVLASLNGISNFTGRLNNLTALEDTCYWLADYSENYHLKYVSFNGKLTSGARHTYYSVVTIGGKTQDDLFTLSDNDEGWAAEFKAVKDVGSILTDMEVAYGASLHINDYYGNGFDRKNLFTSQFVIDDFNGGSSDITIDAYDVNSFATIVKQGNTEYIIYQLEAYPRKAVLDWFKTLNKAHQDKRAFVFTTSFLDKDGNMFTQADPTKYKYSNAPAELRGNTTCNTNMSNFGTPFDGEQIWNYAFSKFDNIIMVMSSNATTGKDIVVNKITNANGYETVAVVSNLVEGYGKSGNAYPVLIKFSEEDKTLDLRYAVPFEFEVGGYVEESKIQIKLDNLSKLPDPDPISLFPKLKEQLNGANTAYINGYAGNLFKPGANMTKAEASTIFARLIYGSQELPKGNVSRFKDVEGHWAYDAIAYLDANNFYYTYEDENYHPNQPITRAEFVELAYFASAVPLGKKTVYSTADFNSPESDPFTDVPTDHKYYDAIMACAISNIVNGYADGTFKPDATITRAEVVTVVNRLLGLIATEDTVVKERLENVFGDIEGHWAEYQILIASNNKVHSKSYYNADTSIYTETPATISFKTNNLEVILNKRTGKVEEVLYLPTGQNVLAEINATPWFAFAKTLKGANLQPTQLELVDGRLKFTFKGGYVAYFIVETFDNYFTVELDSNPSDNISELTFARIDFTYTASEKPGSFRASGILMDTKANYLAVPGGYTSLVGAYTRTDICFEPMGAKVGIAFSLMEDHREHLKEVCLAIDPERGCTSTVGGPFTYDKDEENQKLYGDYVIISSGLNTNNAVEVAQLATKYSFDQIDIHQGSLFSQGDFNFKLARTEEETKEKAYIDGATFKERVADPMHAAGVLLGLHTYSSLVANDAYTILRDGDALDDLKYNQNTYTLRGDLTQFRTNVKTVEDASKFVGHGMAYGQTNSSYILIDDEIIMVGKGTTSGFMSVRRGQFGTTPAEHKDGAKIYQLQGFYSMFQPKPGTDLFWEVADNIAKAYNEGDFDMIYLDGLESFQHFVPSEHRWYYYNEFYRRVVSQCIRKPIIEDSASIAGIWQVRGRGNATDYAIRSIKRRVDGHAGRGIGYAQRYYTASLGWFNFDTDEDEFYKNTLNKTMFHDDLDYVGKIAIAYDFSIVDNYFSIADYSMPTRHADNVMYYSVYSRLRKAGYFSPEVRDTLKKGEYEYKLFKQDDGSYAFREMKYVDNKVYDTTDNLYLTGSANNPFSSHSPFIRIEQRYSTNSENEIRIMSYDETKDISTQVGKKGIKDLNLSKHMAVKVKVYGNGSSNGGVLVSLSSAMTGVEQGRTDYYIPTSHTGWREFILVDADNGDHAGPDFSSINYTWSNYGTYRRNPERNKINSIAIDVAGDTKGVMIDDVYAYTAVDAPAKNPSVTIGGSTITFEAEIHSGEFIEFYPETGKAYLNYYTPLYNEDGSFKVYEAHTKEITYTGSITVPAGNFQFTYGAESVTGTPLRALVKIGLRGKVIKNPADWVAPEVDMGDATLDIIIK